MSDNTQALMDLQKALVEGTNTAGGYLVPEVLAKRVYELIKEGTPVLKAGIFEEVRFTSDNQLFNYVSTTVAGYWVAENTQITEENISFGQAVTAIGKVASLVRVSTELLEDANVDVMDLIVRELSQQLAEKIEDAIINGDGTAAYGGITGLRNVTGTNVVNPVNADGDNISLDKFLEAQYLGRLDNFDYDYIIIHPRELKNLASLKDANNRPIFDQATYGSPLVAEGVVGVLYGMKVVLSNKLPINLTQGINTNATEILVVKSKKCGIFGVRRDLQVHRFYEIEFDRYVIQANMRVGFAVVYPKAICIIKGIIG